MRNKLNQANINNSDPSNYPNGRIRNNTGSNNGTPVNEEVYGDLHEMKDKLMRLYGIEYNNLPDNETNGYQLIDALVALASKNDFILDLTTSGGNLRVALKLGKLKNNESFIVKASSDWVDEENITGTLDNISKSITRLGDFKANEYVRMVNTQNSVVLIRMVDGFNLSAVASDLGFLKKATQTEEDAGTIDTKATTPLINKTTFVKRVNGNQSVNHLALPDGNENARNGLLSSADKFKIDSFTNPASIIKVTSGSWQNISGGANGYTYNNFNVNYFDAFPPTGFSMADFQGAMVSNSFIHYAGEVNGDDVVWSRWESQPDRVRFIAGNSERNSTPKLNWLCFWIKTS